ncbi:bifunctional lytic transglycosylase/C40 family peptidase [Allokutzneria sp. A3M-2-11 16]|uniref:C40 family peptidase n=1 Tax=Allokutzneria sp. A3M-2-11 16 TaxID=2962043 RepID=UPI0020B6B140|nr:bifunctional lytic transglycosylase/C40 family peptidase [Allokutzneria sp. A3M-2-11 16]MCP3800720.1 bifunctional lytic transglycosylase/C40 family peptidase [Allokutzneria sp. A3M-2-11 16]
MKIVLAVAAVLLALATTVLATAHAAVSLLLGGGSTPSTSALDDIPGDYLALYRTAAGRCPGLDWAVLAAIGKVETNHGRSTLPGVHSGANSAKAKGPMQFLQPTFDAVVRRHPLPAGGTNPPSPYNPHDAIHAAAHYLCDNGAGSGDLRRAIFAYNHADWHVTKVLTQANAYRAPAPGSSPNPAAAQAIAYAHGQLGQPYVWGGDGPDAGEHGFDCSGLTKAAYHSAGVFLPRTADAQYRALHRVPHDQLQPGDLVFYDNPRVRITHVGIFIGQEKMIHAPTFNKPVQISDYRWNGDQFVTGARPAH